MLPRRRQYYDSPAHLPIPLGAGVGTTCFVGSTLRRVWQGYTGPLFLGRRADGEELDIYARGKGAGHVDLRQLLDFAAGQVVTLKTVYNEDGSGRHLSQPSPALQPIIVQGGSVESFGSVAAPRWQNDILVGNPNLTNDTSPAMTFGTVMRVVDATSMLHAQVGHPAGAGTVDGRCWLPLWTVGGAGVVNQWYTDTGPYNEYACADNSNAMRSYVARKQLNGDMSAATMRQDNVTLTPAPTGSQTMTLLDGSSWCVGGYYNAGGSTNFHVNGHANVWALFATELAGDALKALELTLAQHRMVA